MVIVSHGFWQQRLGGRPDVIGKPLRLDGDDYQLVGVLPQSLGPLEEWLDVFTPIQWTTPTRKGPFSFSVIARLRSDVERSAAAAELRAINRRLFPLWKASYQDDKATWSMLDLQTFVVGDVRTVAGLALSAVGLVWFIACTNASNLLITRVTSRRRELAVRTALGASRSRVVRCLLMESALLAFAAATLGILLAWAGIVFLRDFGTGYFPRTSEITLDGTVLELLLALTGASTLLFGLIPAIHGTGESIDESLRSMGRAATGSVAVRRLRRILVASQFAIAMPLLIVAGLLFASLSRLGSVDLGFETHNLLSGSIQLPAAQYNEGQMRTFWNELQRRVEVLPGVSDIAFADGRPPDDVDNFNNFDLEESPTPSGKSQPVTPWVAVTPDYFQLLGLTLLEGRLLNERDGLANNVESVVVDRAWAKRFFPGQNAVGKRFKEGGCTTCPWTSVVGVVSEVKYAGLDQPDRGTVYTALEPASRFRYVVVRTTAAPASVLGNIRQVVREIDPGLPFSSAASFDELIDRSLQRPRSLSLLVAAFAVVAVVLSVVGIYGVMSYYVQQHVKDISIRLALGGRPADVVRVIVRQGMAIVGCGILVGLAIAFVVTRFLSSLLFGIGAADSFTYAGTTFLLLIIALAACGLPARRAASVQPASVLRNE
jgi:putative ABC transport system permease protein